MPDNPITLIEKTVINQQLIEAVMENDKHRVQFCLEKGADPKYTEDKALFTPLHIAVIFNARDVVELLVMAGGDLKAETDEEQATPLDLARQRKNTELIALFSKYEAMNALHKTHN